MNSRWLAVMYTFRGSEPLLAVIPKCKIPGEATELLGQRHVVNSWETISVRSSYESDDGEKHSIIHILKWEEVPE